MEVVILQKHILLLYSCNSADTFYEKQSRYELSTQISHVNYNKSSRKINNINWHRISDVE